MNEIISNQIAQYRYYKNVNQGLMSYLFRLYKENNFKYKSNVCDYDPILIVQPLIEYHYQTETTQFH